MLIGITGIPGSGKSTFLSFFKKKGFSVFVSDDVVSELYKKKYILNKIKAKFPKFFEKNNFFKKEFSDFIFSSKKNLNILENILHPLVLKKLLIFKEKNKKKISIAEVPLLFEKKLENLFDLIICVSRDEKESLKKFSEDKKISYSGAKRRASFQLSLKEKEERADFVVKNNGTIKDLEREFEKILNYVQNL